MAGQGTGLPSPTGGEITPLVDLTRSAGAAEQASADALMTFAASVRELEDTFGTPLMVENAQREAEADVARGEFRERTALTPVGESYNVAMRAGATAALSNDMAATVVRLAVTHQFDPDGYLTAAAEARSRFIQNAPTFLAADLAPRWDDRSRQNETRIREARAGRDLQAQAGNIEASHAREVREAIAATQGLPLTEALAALEPHLDQLDENLSALSNPAFGRGADEIEELRQSGRRDIITGVVTNEASRLLATEGYDAAMAFVGSIMTDEDLPLDLSQRESAFEAARARVAGQQAIEQQRLAHAEGERSRREQEANRLTAEWSAHIAMYGEAPDGASVDRIRELSGEAGVRAYYAQVADAYEFQREFPNAGAMTPEQFGAAWAARSSSAARGGRTEEGFVGALDWLWEAEGSALVADDNGAGRARYGITERSHPDAWRDGDVSREEAERIYREEYWDAIGADDLPPDVALVAFDAAVNGGVGHARELLAQSGGDVRRMLELRRQHYRRLADQNPGRYGDDLNGWLNRLDNVANAAEGLAGGGNPWADVQGEMHRQFRDDPFSYVARDPDVRMALTEWRDGGWSDGEGFVASGLAAQARAGVPASDRMTLPMATLVDYAGRLVNAEFQGPEAYRAFADLIISRFGSHGQAVWEDVLVVRGRTRYAAQVAARAQEASRTGGRPPAAAEVREAQRGESIQRATEGSQDYRSMSDAEFDAALNRARQSGPTLTVGD